MKQLTLLLLLSLLLGCDRGKVDDSDPSKELTAEEKVIGTYEHNENREVFLKHGVYESYVYGEKDLESKWEIVDGEIHVLFRNYDFVSYWVYRINKDGSITSVADILDGKRYDRIKTEQFTYTKIKSRDVLVGIIALCAIGASYAIYRIVLKRKEDQDTYNEVIA